MTACDAEMEREVKYEVVIDGAPFTEEPVWVGDDTLVIAHLLLASLRRIDVAKGTSETFAAGPVSALADEGSTPP